MQAPAGLAPGPVARAVGEVRMAPAAQPDTGAVAHLRSFDHLVELIRESRDMTLLFDVETHVRPVAYAPGRLEFQPTPDAPRELAQRLAHRLMGLTGVRWGVSVVAAGGGPTLAEARNTDWQRKKAEAEAQPMVQAVLAAFPGAKVVEVRDPVAQAADAALAPVDDEWDPFESD
jgi:DNA polymerase-3 subunit gamma/tau